MRNRFTEEQNEVAKELAYRMLAALGPGPFVVEKSLAIAMLLAGQLRVSTPDLATSKKALSAFEQATSEYLDHMWSIGRA